MGKYNGLAWNRNDLIKASFFLFTIAVGNSAFANDSKNNYLYKSTFEQVETTKLTKPMASSLNIELALKANQFELNKSMKDEIQKEWSHVDFALIMKMNIKQLSI